jgi:hypothetical protein
VGLAGFHATPEDQTQLTAAQGPFVLLNFLGSFGLQIRDSGWLTCIVHRYKGEISLIA